MMITFPLTVVTPCYNSKGVSLRQLCQIAPFVLIPVVFIQTKTPYIQAALRNDAQMSRERDARQISHGN
jgi:hypothetical protein